MRASVRDPRIRALSGSQPVCDVSLHSWSKATQSAQAYQRPGCPWRSSARQNRTQSVCDVGSHEPPQHAHHTGRRTENEGAPSSRRTRRYAGTQSECTTEARARRGLAWIHHCHRRKGVTLTVDWHACMAFPPASRVAPTLADRVECWRHACTAQSNRSVTFLELTVVAGNRRSVRSTLRWRV